MINKAALLRELFNRPGLIKVVGAHNALGSKLAERAGFDGVWSSGLEISTSYAVPDANILTMSEYLAAAQSMVDAVDIPVIADCDTGYGNSSNVIRMVQKFEAAGVAAVCIEDKQFPKLNSFISKRQELAPVAEFVGKIMAAKNAQRSEEFTVIARVEALIAGWGLEEALKRAHAYANAGADAILIHSKAKTPNPIIEFIHAWDSHVPLVVVPTTYYTITTQELEDISVKMVIYANQGIRAAIQATEKTFAEILHTGGTASVEPKIAPMELVFQLQGMQEMNRNEEMYLFSGKSRTRAVIPAAGDHMEEYSMKHIAADIPMAMLDVNGKLLLQHQLETLNKAGITNVNVIGGYKSDKIQIDGIKLAINTNYRATGIAESLTRISDDYEGETLLLYSDILFNKDVLDVLLKSHEDITLLVDRTYDSKTYSPDKKLDLVKTCSPPSETRRSLDTYTGEIVQKIGKHIGIDTADCEFVGIALLSKEGYALFRSTYDTAKKRDKGGRFHEAASVAKASFADVIQEIIDQRHEVFCVEVSAGWIEIHSFENYKQACALVAQAKQRKSDTSH